MLSDDWLAIEGMVNSAKSIIIHSLIGRAFRSVILIDVMLIVLQADRLGCRDIKTFFWYVVCVIAIIGEKSMGWRNQ